MSQKFDVLVIGGGINGLSTAYHLSKNKLLKVGLIEQFSLGHVHGSSHGFSRIFRSTYLNPVYVKLAKRALMEDWPSLEQDSESKLIYNNSRCIFGEGKAFETYIENICKVCPDLEILDTSTGSQLFPHFNFSSIVIKDNSAALIAAKDTVQNLIKVLLRNKVEIFENTKVHNIDSSNVIKIDTSNGQFTSDRLVITAGSWMNQFISSIPLKPVRQVVGYFNLKGPKTSFQMGQFPLWVFIGEGPNSDLYGLPEFGNEGIKIAQEYSSIESEDPNVQNYEIDPMRVKTLEDFISKHFTYPVERITNMETCFYTDAPNRDFVIDHLPDDSRIVIGSACSGHAFKFAPLTGKILSEMVMNGKTSVKEFEEQRKLFSF